MGQYFGVSGRCASTPSWRKCRRRLSATSPCDNLRLAFTTLRSG